ncbi:RpiB/LacA/LacB family sugar-phosphate isomerase [Candidatus Parcubacteria bacterium]|nr:RpiB/LacA/LacB family sugar-phosphate isomerase [Candidatus Parcubacteria bacterium]
MKIVIASDHAGFELKKYLVNSLQDKGYDVIDMGNTVYSETDDYPDYIKMVGEYISEHNNPKQYRGIVIGGSGQGENICANKFSHVRSVLIYGNDRGLNTEIAKLSRQHNNANVLSLGARFIETDHALEVVQIWLDEEFSNEERHIRRLSKIENK